MNGKLNFIQANGSRTVFKSKMDLISVLSVPAGRDFFFSTFII